MPAGPSRRRTTSDRRARRRLARRPTGLQEGQHGIGIDDRLSFRKQKLPGLLLYSLKLTCNRVRVEVDELAEVEHRANGRCRIELHRYVEAGSVWNRGVGDLLVDLFEARRDALRGEHTGDGDLSHIDTRALDLLQRVDQLLSVRLEHGIAGLAEVQIVTEPLEP